jgi:hypothetical protein
MASLQRTLKNPVRTILSPLQGCHITKIVKMIFFKIHLKQDLKQFQSIYTIRIGGNLPETSRMRMRMK